LIHPLVMRTLFCSWHRKASGWGRQKDLWQTEIL